MIVTQKHTNEMLQQPTSKSSCKFPKKVFVNLQYLALLHFYHGKCEQNILVNNFECVSILRIR